MMKSMTVAIGGGAAALGLMLVLTTPTTIAAGKGRGMQACRTDAAAFCRNVEPGRGARMQCLISNKEKLQPACATAVADRLAERAEKHGDRRSDRRAGLDRPGADRAAIDRPAPNGAAPQDDDDMDPNPSERTAAAEPAPAARHRDLPHGRRGLGRSDVRNDTRGEAQTRDDAPGARNGRDDRRGFGGRSAGGPDGGRPMAACRADIQALCSDVQPGNGGRIRCLAENEAKLTPACSDALAAMGERRQEVRAACKGDVQSMCGTAKGPERRQCLAENMQRLSSACASALKGDRG